MRDSGCFFLHAFYQFSKLFSSIYANLDQNKQKLQEAMNWKSFYRMNSHFSHLLIATFGLHSRAKPHPE